MKVVRSGLVAMLLDIGVKSAPTWTVEEATKRVNDGDGVTRYLDKGEDFTKPEFRVLFDEIARVQFMGEEVEVIEHTGDVPFELVQLPPEKETCAQEASKPVVETAKPVVETVPEPVGRPLIEVLTEEPAPKPVQNMKKLKTTKRDQRNRKVGMVGGTTTLVRESAHKPAVVKLGKRDSRKNGSAFGGFKTYAEWVLFLKSNPLSIPKLGIVRTLYNELRTFGKGKNPPGATKEHLLQVLCHTHPDKDPDGMTSSLHNYVPTRFRWLHGVHVWKKKEKGDVTRYYIVGKGNEPQPKVVVVKVKKKRGRPRKHPVK